MSKSGRSEMGRGAPLNGAGAFAVNVAGTLVPHLYYYGNGLGTPGAAFAVLAPGLMPGLLLVAALRIRVRRRSSRAAQGTAS